MNISTTLFDVGGLAREHSSALPSASSNPPPARRQGVSLALQGLSKSFGERAVLHDIALELHPGEFVAVVGRSGCGKSTLLRAIAGLETADQGTISVGKGTVGANIRIMFQEARLLPWKTVLENVALGLPRALNAAAATLTTVGLGERVNDWPAELSGGQRQRVALARALLHEPLLLRYTMRFARLTCWHLLLARVIWVVSSATSICP